MRETSAAVGARYREIELESQFRCAGSGTSSNGSTSCSRFARQVNSPYPPDEPFEFEIVAGPAELDALIRQKVDAGVSARLTAGFCWKWSQPTATGSLVEDIVIDDFRRPWNAQPDAKKLAPGIPRAPLRHGRRGEVDQVGCVYTAQGFEFDYVGVIFGKDLVVRNGTWIGQPSMSHDKQIKQKTNTRFLECVKNVYRVLMTRGLKGCYVTFLDEETREYVETQLS